MEAEATPTLFSALLAAQCDVETLPKLGRNDHGGFNYAPADQVVRAARKLLARHGLFWVRTGAPIRAPLLGAGRIGDRMTHVGHVALTGMVVHPASGGHIDVCADVPIVAQAATPHDKAWASSVTFGTGYLLLGVLNQDRANAEEISAREDEETPRLAAALADECRAMNDRLAKFEGTDPRERWSTACKGCDVTLDGDGYPAPRGMYATEGERVHAHLSKLVAAIPVPYLELPGARCTRNAKPLADSNREYAKELGKRLGIKGSQVWTDVCREAGIPPLPSGLPHGASHLLTVDGEAVHELLKSRIADCQVEREPGDDDEDPRDMGDSQESLGLSEKAL